MKPSIAPGWERQEPSFALLAALRRRGLEVAPFGIGRFVIPVIMLRQAALPAISMPGCGEDGCATPLRGCAGTG
jgi:hypothetical protein